MATRYEKVTLTLEDNFTSGMAKAAAKTAVLNQELQALDKTGASSAKRLDSNATASGKFSRSLASMNAELRPANAGIGTLADRALPTLGRNTEASGKKIDRLSGRLALLAQAATVLGPALIPIGAAAIPALSGLVTQFTLAAAAAGVAVMAFNGIGDALKSVNEYQLAPTAENLEKMQVQLQKVGPAGAEFVQFLDALGPRLSELQMAARNGLLPGAQAGLEEMLSLLPQVERIITNISTELGQLATEAGAGLAGDGFSAFFDYIETDAGPILEQLGHSIGNVVAGFASMMVDFGPLTSDFSGGLEQMTADFAAWAAGLSQTQSFQDFVQYVRESVPEVLDLIGSLADAFVSIAVAAAPVGDAVLPTLTALVRVLALIADSPIGPPLFAGAAALIAVNRAALLAKASLAALGMTGAATGAKLAALGSTVAVVGVSLGYFSDSMSMVDSLKRSNAAVDGSTSSFASLSQTLQQSNIGKYAQDLGINVQALAADLIENGANGEYASSVLDKLGESSHGAGAMFKEFAGNVLPFYTASSTKAYDANRDLKSILDSLGESNIVEVFDAATGGALSAARAERTLGNDLRVAAGWIDAETSSLEENISAMRTKREETARALNAELNYKASILDARDALKENGKTVNENTRAGQANLRALYSMATGWNAQSDAAKNAKGSLKAAQREFVQTATNMGMAEDKARRLAKRLFEIPARVLTRIDVNTSDADRKIAGLKAQLASIDKDLYINLHVRAPNLSGYGPQIDSAAGNYFPGDVANGHQPTILNGGVTRVWNEPETGGEAYIPLANDGRRPRAKSIAEETVALLGGHVQWFANGGTSGIGTAISSGGGGNARRTLEDQLAIAQALQQIRELRRSLAAEGKDKLDGHARKIARLELEVAEKELRLIKHREEREARAAAAEAKQEAKDVRQNVRGLIQGFSLDSIVPDQAPVTFASQVGDELAQLRADIKDAGGTWTAALRDWAAGLIATAKELDDVTASLAAETATRDALVETLAGQQQALDQLTSTMQSYAASVAGNFLNNPFNGATTRTVAGAPQTGGQSAALTSAEAQLAAIRNSAGGDSVAAAAEASRLIEQIAAMRDAASAADQPTEETVTGLQALRETLEADTEAAESMSAALALLAEKGLDTTGSLGGLYQGLAANGDLATAEELASLSAEQIDEYEKLFAAREDAAALVGAQVTQAVYGQQQAELLAQIDNQNQLIAVSTAAIELLTAQATVLGSEVRAGAAAGAAAGSVPVEQGIRKLNGSVQDIARQIAENARKNKV